MDFFFYFIENAFILPDIARRDTIDVVYSQSEHFFQDIYCLWKIVIVLNRLTRNKTSEQYISASSYASERVVSVIILHCIIWFICGIFIAKNVRHLAWTATNLTITVISRNNFALFYIDLGLFFNIFQPTQPRFTIIYHFLMIIQD
jgi:hypothetical protein